MGKVIVYGYTQNFAVNMKIQIYVNGNMVGEVSKGDKCEFDISENTNIEFKCSFRKSSIMAYKDQTNEIQLSFNRLTGSIEPKLVNGNTAQVAQNNNLNSTNTVKQPEQPQPVVYNNLPNGKKPVNKIAYCLLAFFLGGLGVHKFYAGKVGLGIVYLIFCWTTIPGIIAFIEFIIALTKTADQNGNIIL